MRPDGHQEGHELMLEIGMSIYKDMQKFTIQDWRNGPSPWEI